MSVIVRVPSVKAFIEQQLFVYGNKLLKGPTRDVYIKRIQYFVPYVSQDVKQLIQQRIWDLARAGTEQARLIAQMAHVPQMGYPQMYPQQMYPQQMYPQQMGSQHGLTRKQIKNLITRPKRGGRITKKKNKRTTKKRSTR